MTIGSKTRVLGSIRRFGVGGFAACVIAGAAMSPANAALLSVFQGNGNELQLGGAAAIVAAPSDALDDLVTNTAMQGFDEAQGVVTSVAHGIDGGGSIAAGTLVDSHMIFLNSLGGQLLEHNTVEWTFSGSILGVMSDSGGTLEAASTFELGNLATNYTIGAGAAPFAARGLESNNGTGAANSDGYGIIDPFTLRVSMRVTEPGDWIRVVTAHVPVPAAVWMFLTAIAGLFGFGWKRKRSVAAA